MRCEGNLRLAERSEKLLEEDFARVIGNTTAGLHGYPLW